MALRVRPPEGMLSDVQETSPCNDHDSSAGSCLRIVVLRAFRSQLLKNRYPHGEHLVLPVERLSETRVETWRSTIFCADDGLVRLLFIAG